MKRLALEALALLTVGLISLAITQSVRSKPQPVPEQEPQIGTEMRTPPIQAPPPFGSVTTISGRIEAIDNIIHTDVQARLYRQDAEMAVWYMLVRDEDRILYKEVGEPFLVTPDAWQLYKMDNIFETGLPVGEYIVAVGVAPWHLDPEIQDGFIITKSVPRSRRVTLQ